MHIFLTGGSGLLGSAMRRFWTSCEFFAPEEGEFDLFDEVAVSHYIETNKTDWIINCAAYNNVDGAEGIEKDMAMRVNAELPEHLARVAHARQIPFLHFSTDYVFDGTNVNGYVENDEPSPISVYGISKHLGEQNMFRVNPNAYLVRTSRLYGQKPDSPAAKRSFPEIIFEDARKAARVLVNKSEVSAPTLVDDLARHVMKHILEAKPTPGIYHITNEGGVTWLEWASEIGKILALPVLFAPRDPESLKRPARRPSFSLLRSIKLPSMRPWQEALREFLEIQSWKFEPLWIATGIDGTTIELQPRIGEQDGAVLHMLPGGTKNPHGFGTDILDLYTSTAKGIDAFRGGHYHAKLDELFFQTSGTALWVLSDFREDSPTAGKTAAMVVGIDRHDSIVPSGIPSYFLSDGTFPRLRVPHGVYHAFCPLTDERVTTIGVGSTSYDKEDYRYPTLDEIPDLENVIGKELYHRIKK